jgi:putative phosphoribosyl transferase
VEGAQAVARQADDVVCVATPDRFFGVGAWYHDFTQTTDEEVVDLLRRSQESGVRDQGVSRIR